MEEELIEYVRANPILYDFKNKQYRNQVARKEAWDEIGEKLGKPGDLCKDTWNKLRNVYTNALNRRKTKSGQAAKKMVKWIYEDQMAFVAPTIAPRQTHGNSNGILDDDDADNSETVEEIADDTQPFQPQDVNETVSTDHLIIASPQHPSTYYPFATAQKHSKNKSTRVETAMNELVSIMKNNNRIRSQHLSQNQNILKLVLMTKKKCSF